MPKRVSAPDYCMISRTMDVLGEQWTMLIVRDAFFGVRNFDDFQKSLGIARNVLSDRLGKLVDEGILTRRVSDADRRKVEYRLTDKGRDLFPLIIALAQWGQRWLSSCESEMPFFVADRESGQPVAPVEVRSKDGRKLTSRDTMLLPGPALTDEIRAIVPALRRAG